MKCPEAQLHVMVSLVLWTGGWARVFNFAGEKGIEPQKNAESAKGTGGPARKVKASAARSAVGLSGQRTKGSGVEG